MPPVKKKNHTEYLFKFKDKFKEVCEKHGFSEEEGSEIVDSFFWDLKESISDPRMPSIMLTNFGSFRPTLGKIRWKITNAIQQYREGRYTREITCNVIRRYWEVRNRLILEKYFNRYTHKEWSRKKIDKNAKTKD